MTTPALSVNANQIVTGTRWQKGTCSSAFVQNATATMTVRNVQESRPASVNKPKNRSGWRDPSAWSHSKLVHNPHPSSTVGFYATACGKVTTEYRDGYFWQGSTSSSLPAFPSYLSQVARSRMLLRLKDQQVNISVAIAEAHQTKQLFSDAARKIAQAVSAFRGKNPKAWGQVVKNGAKSQWRNIPREWLAMQYGWKPLMSDVEGACNSLDKTQQDPNCYSIRVIGRSHGKVTSSWNKQGSVSTAARFVVTDVADHFCKVVCHYNLRRANLARFASLGLTNPGELIWEKTPYSFVIDWFLPVGNWLSTLDADLAWDFKSGTETKFTRLASSSKFQAGPSYPPGVYAASFGGDTYKADGFSMTRSVLSSSPSAGFPSFKNPLSSTHIANAMSLLVNAFRR